MKPYLKTKDYSVTGEGFELRYDGELEMLTTHPRPDDLERYYESDTYISHTDSRRSLVDKLYQAIKRLSLQRKTSLVNNFSMGNKTLLDFGAGTGDFLKATQKAGWLSKGIEPNKVARSRAEGKDVELLSSLKALPKEKFQVITLWHVLEHLPDLEMQIIDILEHLEKEGTLIIAVPNFNSFDAKYYKEFWAAYDVPRHLWHFSRKSIEKLFSKHGLKVVKTKPMIFDSFYVSLLSEKYKSGKQKFIKGFWIGLRSNLAAWGSGEYSSIIYILQKRQK